MVSHLPILAVAFGIYIFGISIVLYVRPNIMFKTSGTWKEFGIGRGDERTVIPFWLFAIFWAFISYGSALVIMSQFANIALNAFPESLPVMGVSQPNPGPMQQPNLGPMQQPNLGPMQQPVSGPSFMKPVSSALGINSGNPGFYVLQGYVNGAPNYVYYGQTPPQS